MKLLLTADLHLRHDMPRCRVDDDWMESQRKDLENIVEISKDKEVDAVFLLGDIFHRPVEPPEVVNMFIQEFNPIKDITWLLIGNHDVKYHNVELKEECSIGTVLKSFYSLTKLKDKTLNVTAFNFGTESGDFGDIVCSHQLVFPSEESRGLAGGKTAEEVVKEFGSPKALLMGDYHEGWEKKVNDTLCIMCGCMNIQSGKLKDYKPHVIILDSDTLEYEKVYLDQSLAKITTEHLVEAAERADRIQSCIDGLSGVESVEFNFRENLADCTKELDNNIVNELTTYLDEVV